MLTTDQCITHRFPLAPTLDEATGIFFSSGDTKSSSGQQATPYATRLQDTGVGMSERQEGSELRISIVGERGARERERER
jgi:hypothetical protein